MKDEATRAPPQLGFGQRLFNLPETDRNTLMHLSEYAIRLSRPALLPYYHPPL
jgi:hypothetical protein